MQNKSNIRSRVQYSEIILSIQSFMFSLLVIISVVSLCCNRKVAGSIPDGIIGIFH